MSQGASLSEPRSIVQSLTSKFQAAADVAAVQRIDAAFEKIQTSRAEKLAVSRDTLHQWMKKVEGAKWEAQRSADKSEASQAERMAQLERDRITLAKTMNDFENILQGEESNFVQVSARLEMVKKEIAALEGQRNKLNENEIRIAVYRDLGVTWAIDELQGLERIGDLENHLLKCRVISRRSNDVFTLKFGPHSNPFEDAQQLWKHLEK